MNGFFLSVSDAEAKTIALVYDDSGSMKENQRWIYANYAVQTLVALLSEGDRIEVFPINKVAAGKVRSNAVTRWTLKSKRKEQLAKIFGWGVPRGKYTRYQAVVYAQEALLKQSASRAGGATGQKDQDWLIITTDGEFDADSQSLRTIEPFIRQSRGNIRVAFLLIGKKADSQIAEIWQRAAAGLGKAGMVEVLRADADSIADEMTRIAALISGRDTEPVTLAVKGKTARFASPFPLRRFIIIQQNTTQKRLSQIKRVSINDTGAGSVLHPYAIAAPQDRMFGRISQVYDRGVMPAGQYALELARSGTTAGDLTVLAEAAVDFEVVVEDVDTNRRLADHELTDLCEGQALRVKVIFHETGKKTPLQLDPAALGELSVMAKYGSSAYDLQIDPTHNLFAADIKVKKGEAALSVEARFPKYFHFKSKIKTVAGVDCSREGSVGISANEIPVPYIYSKDYKIADEMDIKVLINNATSRTETQTLIFTAEGIPVGIELHLNGKPMDARSPVVKLENLPTPTTLKLTVARNKHYRSAAAANVRIVAESDSPLLTMIEKNVDFVIAPRPRDIAIKTTPPPKSYSPLALGRGNPPIRVNLLNGGQPVSVGELREWRVDLQTQCRVSMDWHLDSDTGDIRVYPNYHWFSPCFTQVGETPFVLTAHGPFPGEAITRSIPINIQSLPLWRRCLPLAIKILWFVLICLWVLGIVVKPRFKRTAKIEYQRIRTRNARRTSPQRVQTTLLRGNFLSRWLIPYRAERKRIEGKRFKAGRRGRVYLPKNQQPGDVPIYQGGSRVPDPGQRDIRLSTGEKLTFEYGNFSEAFTYI